MKLCKRINNQKEESVQAKGKVSKTKKLLIIFAILLLLCAACGIYLGTYYHASCDMTDIIEECEKQDIIVDQSQKGMIAFVPEKEDEIIAGMIFYPGAKVEYTAYSPLMVEFAKKNVVCILIQMPCNMAFFDINAADGIKEKYPNVSKWYMAGHSLGGSMAASYLKKHVNEYDGLLLTGSYSTADFSKDSLDVLSVYGSEDQVLNINNYDKYKTNLPTDFSELVIEGGCHAYFGMYGPQKGDGTPSIEAKDQMAQTANAFEKMILKK